MLYMLTDVDVVVVYAKLSEHKFLKLLFACKYEEDAAGAHQLPWWPGRRHGSVSGHKLTNGALCLRLRHGTRTGSCRKYILRTVAIASNGVAIASNGGYPLKSRPDRI